MILSASRLRLASAFAVLAGTAGVAGATSPQGNLFSDFTTFSNRGPSSEGSSERVGIYFVPTTSGTVSSLSIPVQNWGSVGSESFTLQLRSDSGGLPGSLLGSGTGIATTTNSVVTVNISGNPGIFVGTTYWVVFYDNGVNGVSWNDPSGDPRANIHLSENSGGSWSTYSDYLGGLKVTGLAYTPPTITLQPVGQTLNVGDTLSLTASAAGAWTYQWRQGGSNIAGATSSSYSKTAAATDTGTYDVVITGAGGSVTSNAVTVLVSSNPAPSITTAPVGQELFVGQTLTLTIAADNATSYEWFKDDVTTGVTTATFSKTAALADAGDYTCQVTGPGGVTTPKAVTVVVDGAPSIAAAPSDQVMFVTQTVYFAVSADGVGLSYQWYHDGVLIPGAGAASYSKAGLTSADAGTYTVMVVNPAGTVSSSASLVVYPAPGVVEGLADQTLFATQTLSLSVGASGSSLNYQWRKGGVLIPGQLGPTYTKLGVTAADAGTYTVTVMNPAGSVQSSASVSINGAPSITTGPVAQTLFATQTLDLSVSASGSGLTYQWYLNEVAIPVANSASYHKTSVGDADAGSYSVVVSNPAGSASTSAVVVVQGPPVVTASPVGVTLFATQQLSLSVSATGAGLGYQWRHDGTPIMGATSASFVKIAALADAGSYDCVVSNPAGSGATSAATVVVDGPPEIVSAPESQTVFATQTLTLAVTASGSGLTYQWSKDGTPIVGATAATFSKTASLADAGSYVVTVSNPAGSAQSSATIAVNAAPVITTGPADQTLFATQAIDLAVSASGSGLSYQWSRNETPIAGATSPSYHKAGASTDDAGSYSVAVTNPAGTVSASATVVVHGAPVITAAPVGVTVFATHPLTLSVSASGFGLTYQWRHAGTAIAGATSASFAKTATLDDAGDFDCVVSNPAGSATSNAATVIVYGPPAVVTPPVAQTLFATQTLTLTVVASGAGLHYQWLKDGDAMEDAITATFTKTMVLGDAGSYSVVVSNPAGEVTSIAALVSVNGPPLITSSPSARTVFLNNALSLRVTATGAGLTYQWRKDGVPLAGAITAHFVNSSAVMTDAGQYDCVVANPAGSVTSAAAIVTVMPAAAITSQPVGQTVFAGQTFTMSVGAVGSSLSYHWSKDGVIIQGASSAQFSKLAEVSDTGTYVVTVGNPGGYGVSDPALIVVNGPPTIVTAPANQTVFAGQPISLSVVAAGAGLSYQWRKDGAAIAGATGAAFSKTAAATDLGSYDVVVSNPAGSIISPAAGVSVDGAPALGVQPQDQSVFDGQAFLLTVSASGTGLTYQWRHDGQPIAGATSASFSETANADNAGGYDVVVSNGAGSLTSRTATVTISGGPVVVTQPADRALFVGETLELSVVVSGAGLSYQWRKDGTAIAGATSASFAKLDAAPGDAGQYDVAVSNPAGSTNSAPARVTVSGAPVITQQPTDQTLYAGQVLTLEVAASGAGVGYQWRKDGVAIAGEQAMRLSKTALVADSGVYDVVVSNAGGSVVSAPANVQVSGAPVITSLSGDQAVLAGGTLSLAVTASGQNLSYQWQQDGMPLPGATSSHLRKPGATTADSGTYEVVVSNPAGQVTSNPIQVYVHAVVVAGDGGTGGADGGSDDGGSGDGGSADGGTTMPRPLQMGRDRHVATHLEAPTDLEPAPAPMVTAGRGGAQVDGGDSTYHSAPPAGGGGCQAGGGGQGGYLLVGLALVVMARRRRR